MRRLNMWQRMGIVASGLWMVAAGPFAWVAGQRDAETATGRFIGDCNAYRSAPTVDEEGAGYRKCLGNSDHVFDVQMRAVPTNAAIAAFVPVILGWMLAFVGLRTARWVLAGRNKPE